MKIENAKYIYYTIPASVSLPSRGKSPSTLDSLASIDQYAVELK
jgi:hypothetical protein